MIPALRHPDAPGDRFAADEARLLAHFAGLPGARLVEFDRIVAGRRQSIFQAELSGGLVGTGRGPGRRPACVTAVAECLERRFVAQAFAGPLSRTPAWRRNSNGFAVHFDPALARESAVREALERHILQVAYFRKGWDGFRLLEASDEAGLRLTRLAARYRCDGHRAGIVVATSERFPGVSVGSLCAVSDDFEESARWAHARHECVDKVEPMLAQVAAGLPPSLPALERAAYALLLGPRLAFGPADDSADEELPQALPGVIIFNLKELWRLDFPFFAAHASGPATLPLIVPGGLTEADRAEVARVLARET